MNPLSHSVAQVVFGHQGISRRLEKSLLVQRAAHLLQLRRWLNGALALRPIHRIYKESGVQFKIENFETIAVEKSYFNNPFYREIFRECPPVTFLDLGCNSGIFPCFLAHISKGSAIKGICIDANAAQVDLTRKAVQLNGWRDVHVVNGLVGAKYPERENARFYIHPTSLGSSQFSYSESESGIPPPWQETNVPTVKASALWADLMSDVACDCLKIDIEGSEMNFLSQEAPFLTKVSTVLVEWHSWTTSRKEMIHFLLQHNFILEKTIEDTLRHGVLFFKKRH